MCNYYAVYLRNPRNAQAYISFLRKNALQKGVQYILYPKLHEFPKVFQDHQFGIKYPNFLGILYYGGDAAMFPSEFEWPGVILDHVYSQQLEAEDYVAKKVLNFVRMQALRPNSSSSSSSPARPVRRFREEDIFRQPPGRTMFENNYYRMLDRFNKETFEIERLLADHKEVVDIWKREHSHELYIARLDRERIDGLMRHKVSFRVKRMYEEWKAKNPGKTRAQCNEYYASLFETELKKMRYDPDFKYPLDLIEKLYASKPHKSPELKQRIADHKKLGEEIDRIGPIAQREGDEWSEMVRRDMSRGFDD